MTWKMANYNVFVKNGSSGRWSGAVDFPAVKSVEPNLPVTPADSGRLGITGFGEKEYNLRDGNGDPCIPVRCRTIVAVTEEFSGR
jgi:hypothetical protein